MKPHNPSIDDLHQAALAECEGDPERQAFLNTVYSCTRKIYRRLSQANQRTQENVRTSAVCTFRILFSGNRQDNSPALNKQQDR